MPKFRVMPGAQEDLKNLEKRFEQVENPGYVLIHPHL